MGNRVDEMMDDWGSEADPEKLFSDQIEEDSAFLFEEPEIGLNEMTLDEPQAGSEYQAPKDKLSNIDGELKNEGLPGILKIETDQLEKLAKDRQGIEIGNELDRMLGYISEYGIIHGLGLFYAENDNFIEDDYGKEESLGQSPGDIQTSE